MKSSSEMKEQTSGALSRRAVLDGVALVLGGTAVASVGCATATKPAADPQAAGTSGALALSGGPLEASTPNEQPRSSTVSTITRSTPDIGYIDPAVYKSINISQTVRANDTVYFSGIVAAIGHGAAVAKGDAPGQIRAVLHTLDRLLTEEGIGFANLVSTTVYTTDVDAIAASLAIFAQAFEGHPPTMTLIEVKRLASPDYLLELVAIAVL